MFLVAFWLSHPLGSVAVRNRGSGGSAEPRVGESQRNAGERRRVLCPRMLDSPERCDSLSSMWKQWRMKRLCKSKGHVWAKHYNPYGNALWYECSACGKRQHESD